MQPKALLRFDEFLFLIFISNFLYTKHKKQQQLCNSFSTFDFEIVVQNLLDFFQDKYTKVSLFIDAGLQKPNGHFFYEPKVIPTNSLIPGTIKLKKICFFCVFLLQKNYSKCYYQKELEQESRLWSILTKKPKEAA